MNCFPCLGQRRKDGNASEEPAPVVQNKPGAAQTEQKAEISQTNMRYFNFRELAAATRNFRQECVIGEGGFGRVYKGKIPGKGQVVAVKKLDRNGMHGSKEFVTEVSKLSSLEHPNLVKLIGYCADGDQRLLVYEYISGGSLADNLFGDGPNKNALDWSARVKIAFGTAEGLEHLHEKADPPLIYRDFKPLNILLDEECKPQLSGYGLSNLAASGDSCYHVSSIGTYGYSAPESSGNGQVTVKSDVYSFGVVLMELITGRKAVDTSRPIQEQNLVAWAQPLFKDPKSFPDMADPNLNKQFPEKDLNQIVAVAAMCLQDEPSVRPLMSDIVTTLSFLGR